jgi:hypothetical protein
MYANFKSILFDNQLIKTRFKKFTPKIRKNTPAQAGEVYILHQIALRYNCSA